MRRPHLHIGILLYICVLIGGCAGRSAPAPVVLLNSQVSDGSEEYTKKTYKVQRGDTLYAVAWYTGNDYRDLAKYNQLSAPYTIFPGQVLNVTPPSNVATAPVIPKSKTNRSTAPTTSNVDKSLVDRPQPQAYRESEKVVKPQNVTTVKKPSKSVKKTNADEFSRQSTRVGVACRR